MIQDPKLYYQNSSAARSPLRIGLLLDSSARLPAFTAKVIADIKASNFARIELLVIRPSQNLATAKRKSFLYDLYLRLDAHLGRPNDPLADFDTQLLLSGIPTLEADAAQLNLRSQFPPQATEEIRSRDLDVLLQFQFEDLLGDILSTARYGVWSLHHGDPEFYRSGPSYFWELLEGSPLSGVTLQMLTNDQSTALVLSKSLFATEKTISASRNRYIPYWGSTGLVIQKLHDLHEFGWEAVAERAVPSPTYKGKRAVYGTPTNGDLAFWLGPILLKKAATYPFRKERVQHWRIAIRMNGRALHEPGAFPDFSGFRWLDPTRGHALADPFVFEHEGNYWAFFEDYSYREKRAGIACAEVSPSGEFGPPIVCLRHPAYHYSYPHVFRAGSDIFMIPESFDSNSVDLYRCKNFPNDWVQEVRLLEGKYVDTTVWQHEGLWWLATTSADPVPGAGSLWLYYANTLTDEWHFHPANPISTDIRRNRGAGRVFRSQNRLIRPSQSCAPTYGYSITLNEITELSKQRYSEQPLISIGPEHWKGIAGVHTYNCAGPVELIDGRTPLELKQTELAPH
jgi:hypothetical protein